MGMVGLRELPALHSFAQSRCSTARFSFFVYAGASVQTAAEGVARAKAIVADTSAKLTKLRAINEKLEKLAAEYDARAVASASAAAAGGAGAASRPLA